MPTKKKKNGSKKPDFLDRAILTAKKKNPSLKLNAIAQTLTDNGFIKAKPTVYKRYKKSDYLQAEFAQIDQQMQEKLVRELEPAASKLLDSVVKNGTVKKKVKDPETGKSTTKWEEVSAAGMIDAAKHISKHAWGEKVRSQGSSGISIEAIQNAQFIITSELETDEKRNQ